MIRTPRASLLLLLLAAQACTEPNPGYLPGGDSELARDAAGYDGVTDGELAKDLQQLPDQVRPDLLPDPCEKVGDCRDGLGCTDDRCVDGRCANPVREGFCVIGGVCYAEGQSDASFPCLVCDPEQNQRDWSQREAGYGCDSDDLDCTDDICAGGECTHPISSGCLIDGVCQQAGYMAPSDECRVCMPDLGREALTFVDGKLCDKGEGLCAFDTCRHVVDKAGEWLPTLSGRGGATSARCSSVDAITHQGGVWAVGSYADQNARMGGFLVRVDASGQQALAPRPLTDISHRAAVGEGGVVYLHDGQSWSRASSIEKHLGGVTRRGVGGFRVGTRDVFYLAGTQAPPASAGIVRCVIDGASVSCQDQLGLTTGTSLSPLTIGSGNSIRVWSVGKLLAGPTIYSALESSSTFSDAPLEGCDASALCGFRLAGELRGLHASSDGDVWAVGDAGTVLRYDLSRWVEVKGLSAAISDYTLTAVYSSQKTPLTLLVGFSTTLTGRRVAVFGYNRDLQRGSEPLVVETLSGLTIGDPGRLTHVGGSEPDQIWLVGYRSSSVITSSSAGWMLRLE